MHVLQLTPTHYARLLRLSAWVWSQAGEDVDLQPSEYLHRAGRSLIRLRGR